MQNNKNMKRKIKKNIVQFIHQLDSNPPFYMFCNKHKLSFLQFTFTTYLFYLSQQTTQILLTSYNFITQKRH